MKSAIRLLVGVQIWAILLAFSGSSEDLNPIFTESRAPNPSALWAHSGEEISTTPLPFPGQASQKQQSASQEQKLVESEGPPVIWIRQTIPASPSLTQYFQHTPHGPVHYRAADLLYPFHFFW